MAQGVAHSAHEGPASADFVKLKIMEMSKICSFYDNIVQHAGLLRQADELFANAWVVEGSRGGQGIADKLLTVADQALVNRVCHHRSFRLPVFGSNSAGKSSFINTLLGGKYMPAGQGTTTARVCVVAYAPLESAYIKCWSLQELEAGKSDRIRLLRPDEKSIDGVKDLLKHQLAREYAVDSQGNVLPQNSAAFREWTQTIVEIGYPFPILAGGLSLCDVPGVASVDSQAVQDIIVKYFQSEPPLGVVLVYDNPTFSDAEMSALRVLERLPSSPEHPLSLFLVNSHADGRILQESYNGPLPSERSAMIEACNQLIEQRYQLLRCRAASLGPFPLQDTAAKHGAFAIMSSLDYGMVLYKKRMTPNKPLTGTEEATKYLYEEQCVGALLDWALQRQKLRYQAALHKMSSGACVFFGNLMAAHEDRYQQAVKDQERARQTLATLKSHLESSMLEAFSGHNISSRVKEVAGRTEVINNMRKQAQIMKLDAAYEGQKGDKVFCDAALDSFQSKFIPILREFVFEPVLRDVLADLREKANEHFKQLEESAKNENDLLANALQGYWLHDPSLSNAIQAQVAKAKSTSGMNLAVIQFEWKRSVGAGLKAVTSGFFDKVKSALGVHVKIDAEWKGKQASMFLANVHQLFEHETVSQRCQDTITQSIGDIQGRIDLCIKQIKALQEREKTRPEEIATLRVSLSELLVLCRADSQYLIDAVPVAFNHAAPTLVDEHFSQYRATSGELVKVFHESALTSNPTTRRMFLDEVHFNTAVGFGSTSLNARSLMCVELDRTSGMAYPTPAVLPALASSSSRSNFSSTSREWHLIFPSCPNNLGQVLEAEKPYMTDLNCAQLALALTNRVCALCDSGMASHLTLTTVYSTVTSKIDPMSRYVTITDIDVFPDNVKSISTTAMPTSSVGATGSFHFDRSESNSKKAQLELMEPLERILFELLPAQPFPLPARADDPLKTLHPIWTEILRTCKSQSPHSLLQQLRRLVKAIENPNTVTPTYTPKQVKQRIDTPQGNPGMRSFGMGGLAPAPAGLSPDPFQQRSFPPNQAFFTSDHHQGAPLPQVNSFGVPQAKLPAVGGGSLSPFPPSASSPSPFGGGGGSPSPFPPATSQRPVSPDPFKNSVPQKPPSGYGLPPHQPAAPTGQPVGLTRATPGAYQATPGGALPADLGALNLTPLPATSTPPLATAQLAGPQLGPRRLGPGLGPKQPLGQSRLTQLPADVGFSSAPLTQLGSLPPLASLPPLGTSPLPAAAAHNLPPSAANPLPGIGALPRLGSGTLYSNAPSSLPQQPSYSPQHVADPGAQSFVPVAASPLQTRPQAGGLPGQGFQLAAPQQGLPASLQPSWSSSSVLPTQQQQHQPPTLTLPQATPPAFVSNPATTPQLAATTPPILAAPAPAPTASCAETQATVPAVYRASFTANLKHRFSAGYSLLKWDRAETDEEGGEYQYKLKTNDGKVFFVAVAEDFDSSTLPGLQGLRDAFMAENPGALTLLLVMNVMDEEDVASLPPGVGLLRFSI